MGQLPAPAGEGCSGGVKGRGGVAEGLQLRAAVRLWGGSGEAFWALAGGLTTTGVSRRAGSSGARDPSPEDLRNGVFSTQRS